MKYKIKVNMKCVCENDQHQGGAFKEDDLVSVKMQMASKALIMN